MKLESNPPLDSVLSVAVAKAEMVGSIKRNCKLILDQTDIAIDDINAALDYEFAQSVDVGGFVAKVNKLLMVVGELNEEHGKLSRKLVDAGFRKTVSSDIASKRKADIDCLLTTPELKSAESALRQVGVQAVVLDTRR